MPELQCPCGYVHNLSDIHQSGWFTISGKDFASAAEAILKMRESSGNSSPPTEDNPRKKEYSEAMKDFVFCTGQLFECPKCKRIMWLRSPAHVKFQIYKP